MTTPKEIPVNVPLPTIPGWIPPLDTGQPSADVLNSLGQLPKQTFAARNSIIPICYGRDRMFGKPFVVHVDETNGFLYVAYAFCEGEIGGFETVFVDGVDVNDGTDGFLLSSGSAIELHTGTAGQATSTLLSGAITGYTDTAASLAYVVIKAPQDSTQGFPKVEAIVQGKKIPDSRNSSMGGGDIVRVARKASVTSDLKLVSAITVEYWVRLQTGWAADVDAGTGHTGVELSDGTDEGYRGQTSAQNNRRPRFVIWVDTAGVRRDTSVSGITEMNDGEIHHLAYTYDAASGKRVMRCYLDGLEAGILDLSGESFTTWDIRYDTVSAFTVGAFGLEDYQDIRVWNHERTAAQIKDSFENPAYLVGNETGLVGYWPVYETSGTNINDYSTGSLNDLTLDGSADAQIAGDAFKGLRPSSTTPIAFSTNPTLCFADFVENNTNWVLDYDAINTNADNNDELVNGIKRREIGLTLAKPSLINSWVKGFRAYIGAFLGWEGGKVRVVPNRPDVEAPGAVLFDGVTGAQIDMGDQAVLDFDAAQDFTVEAMFKTTGSGTQQIVCKKSAPGGAATAGWTIHINATPNVVCRIADGTNDAAKFVSGNLNDDKWHHIAMVIDQTANLMTVYVDGVAQSTVDISSVTLTLANAIAFRIGEAGGGGDSFDGPIDEVRVWNDIRTSTEITDNQFSEILDPALDSSLIGYWKLNEVDGLTAVDSSSQGNDGTLAGGVAFINGNNQIIPDGVAMHIGVDDILKGSLSLSKRSMRSVPNSVAVDYEFSTSTAKWHTERVQADSPRVSSGAEARRLSRINLPGIHDASQAKREATERLNWYLTDLEAKVTLFDPGWNLQNGSVVAMTHPIGLDAKLFRVRRITASSGRWTLDLVEYDPAIYSDEVISDPTTPDTNLGNPLNPPTVSGLSAVEELFKYKSGLTGSRVRASWTATNFPFLSQYLVEGYVDGTLVWQTFTQTNSVVTPGVEELVSEVAVDYEVRVYIQSSLSQGAAATDTVSILGKLAVPGDVPSLTLTQTEADTVAMIWGEAVDIDIWRYEVRHGNSGDTWEQAHVVELIDGLNHFHTALSVGTHKFLVKARDSVGNESVNDVSAEITLSVPDPVSVLNGFEVSSEVRLNWPAVTTGFVERYRIAFDTIPPTTETTLDTVDTLRFQTKDVAEGTFTFKVYAVDKNGIESATAATLDIEVTSDAEAFLADTFNFVSPTLTNMVSYDLRLDDKTYYVTNMGDVFAVSPTDFVAADPLANYHSTGASEWLSETKDFGILLTGSWNLTHDVTSLQGDFVVQLELSTDDVSYSVFSGSAKGVFRYARVRITTSATPGTATAFVKTPLMSLKVNVVPLEESGTDSSLTSGGKQVVLSREYTALKEINAQPKNKVDALSAIVDNIIIGPNTGIKFDGTDWLISSGDVPEFDFGASGDFTFECWAINDASATVSILMAKRSSSTSTGYEFLQLSNEELRMTLDDGTVDLDIDTTGTAFPNDGQYHHIAVVVDRTADTCEIFVDAVSKVSGSITTLTASMDNGAQFSLGARAGGASKYTGVLDEARMWNDKRSSTELNDNKDAEISATSANLVGYWKMDGTVSAIVTTVQDEHTNNNDLSDTGAGDLVYADPGEAGNLIQKVNSFDVYIFDIFGQQLAESFQWNWKAV